MSADSIGSRSPEDGEAKASDVEAFRGGEVVGWTGDADVACWAWLAYGSGWGIRGHISERAAIIQMVREVLDGTT